MTDAYLVLARKYRPQSFDALVGQEHVAKTLRNAIEQNRVAHAFLFTGIRGVGKTTAARLLARALNCKQGPTPDPCGTCANCKEIADGISMDVAEIDGASNRGIDSIRELNENVRYRPANSRYRIYIIDEAHMVTKEGFNALLKTLEEPPGHVKFIFATTAVDKFPDTIVSRCQRYDFHRIPLDRIKAQLGDIAAKEGVKISDGAVYLVAREAEGSMRDAESLLDRLIAFCGKEIDDGKVAEVLAVTERRTLYEVADAVLAADPGGALERVDAIHAAGRDLERLSRDFVEHFRNLVVAKIYDDGKLLKDLPDAEVTELRRQAGLRSLADLQRLLRLARQGDQDLRASEYPRLVVEMTITRMATLEPLVAIDDVLARLDEIERSLRRGAPVEGRPARDSMVREPAPPPRRPAPAPVESARRPAPEPQRPAPVPKPATDPAVQRSGNGPGANAARWGEFLEFVQRRAIALYMNLHHAGVVGEGPGELVLGVTGATFRRELERREAVDQIEKLATEFFGAPTRVTIGTGEANAARPATPPPPSPSELLENPAVKKAVEVLGGEVREVRNRR